MSLGASVIAIRRKVHDHRLKKEIYGWILQMAVRAGQVHDNGETLKE